MNRDVKTTNVALQIVTVTTENWLCLRGPHKGCSINWGYLSRGIWGKQVEEDYMLQFLKKANTCWVFYRLIADSVYLHLHKEHREISMSVRRIKNSVFLRMKCGRCSETAFRSPHRRKIKYQFVTLLKFIGKKKYSNVLKSYKYAVTIWWKMYLDLYLKLIK